MGKSVKGMEVPVVIGFIRAADQVWLGRMDRDFLIDDTVWVFIR